MSRSVLYPETMSSDVSTVYFLRSAFYNEVFHLLY